MARAPKKDVQPHSTAKKSATNKAQSKRQPKRVGDPPACGCTPAEIVALWAAGMYALAGAQTGDNVQPYINGAGEPGARIIPIDGRVWAGQPNGPGWTAVNQEGEEAVIDAAKNEDTSEDKS